MTFFLPALGAIAGGLLSNSANKRAVKASTAADQAAINEQRRQFDISTSLLQPTIGFQNSAQSSLARLLGLGGGGGGRTSPPGATPGFNPNARFNSPDLRGGGRGPDRRFDGFGINAGFQQNGGGNQAPPDNAAPLSIAEELRNTPGYQFNLEEAGRNRNAFEAGRGQFFSGAAGQGLQRDAQGIADNTFNNRVNQLLAAASGGQSAQVASNQAINHGTNVGGLISNQGNTRASGILGRSNTIGNLINGAISLYSAKSDGGGNSTFLPPGQLMGPPRPGG